MSIRGIKLTDVLKLAFGVIITLMLSIGGYAFARVGGIEDRVMYIADNYARKEDLKRIDKSINGLRVDMKDMLQALKEEIRYERDRQAKANK